MDVGACLSGPEQGKSAPGTHTEIDFRVVASSFDQVNQIQRNISFHCDFADPLTGLLERIDRTHCFDPPQRLSSLMGKENLDFHLGLGVTEAKADSKSIQLC